MKKNTTIIIIALLSFTLNLASAQSGHLLEIGSLDSLYSNQLGENRQFWVQMPPYYNPTSNIKYPVVYVLDGSVHLRAVSTVHSYYYGGFMPEMIIVGISNQNNRTRDLTTSVVTTRRGRAYNEENGKAENFTQFLEEELIPHIDAKYPTTDYRTLIGHSYAGLFTINTLINHAHLFNNYIAIDPSLDWDDQKLLKQLKANINNIDLSGRSLFISLAGQLHLQNPDITIDNVMQDTSEYSLFARSNIEFSRLMDKNKSSGLNMKWQFYENDIHGTIPLPSIMDGLIHLFDWYPIEHTDKFNSPETPTKELVEIIRNREEKLEHHFGYKVPPFDEQLFNMLGYMNMDMGQPDKSLTFFKLNIEYNPESANAYDSIADYYMSQKDYQKALINVKKANSISPNPDYMKRIEDISNKLKKE